MAASNPPASDPPAARRPLQLSARSAAESGSPSTTDSSAVASSSSRASPFGAARPIDTAAKEREVDEKLAKQRAEMATQQAARDKEREEKKAKAAATEGASGAAGAEASKSEGAWVRKGPLPPSQQRHNSRDSNKQQQQQPAAAERKDLPPPVPTVGEPAPAAATQRKEGFSYSKAAGKSDGGVDEVIEGVEQAKIE